MQQKPSCIYCGTEVELSESDIIPDALTNARIINKNVCKTEHNNKFSDLFESKIVKELAFITNELDVKSSKSKKYPSYQAIVEINGVEYEVSKSSDRSIFDGRVLKSKDKKYLMSLHDKLKQIVKNPEEIEFIDINDTMIEQRIGIGLDVYFCEEMFRMVAKIAFEWYCTKNEVYGYHQEFANIISFITTGQGANPVTIIQNTELYNLYEREIDLGSHCLFGFQDSENKINVVFSLFGIVMYRIIVTDKTPEFCSNNFLYTELRTDSSRKEIVKHSYEQAEEFFFQSVLLNESNFNERANIGGLEIKIANKEMSADVLKYPFVFNMVKCFIGIRDDIIEPNIEIKDILLHNINNVLQASLLHKKSIKRFVNEYFYDGHQPIKLNPNSTHKKTTFYMYILYYIGMNEIQYIDDTTLQNVAKSALNLSSNTEVVVNDEMQKAWIDEIFVTENYSEILEKGANVIKEWKN